MQSGTLGPSRSAVAFDQSGERVADGRKRLVHLGPADRERRSEPQHIGPGGQDEQAALAAGVGDLRSGAVDLGYEEEATTPNLGYSRQCGKAGSERFTLSPHAREQLVVDRLDDGAGGRARDGVAAERG